MTVKEELNEYIKNLTSEQAEKVMSRLPLLERCLSMNDAQVIYTDALTGKLFGK